jgi:alpha-beta hydrolase superfamily lysophospholipase
VELRRRQRRCRQGRSRIDVPTLVIGNLADNACTPSHTRRLFEAIGHPDKEMHEIPGANHYLLRSRPAADRCARPSVSAPTGCRGTGSHYGRSPARWTVSA